MLGQRHHQQQPSERWFDPEARDARFNIMSPTGRIRPFKGIALPNNKIGGIPWERSNNHTMMDNVHSREEQEPVLGMGQALYSVHAPTDMDGISFVYTKGPAGQTPFPTLVAMSGYFPHQQQQQQPLQSSSGITPNQLDRAACALVPQSQPPSVEVMARASKPNSCLKSHSTAAAATNDSCAPSRKHAHQRPRSDSRALTLDQAQRWRRQPVHQR